MATGAKNDARINFRLPSELKEVIEEAAATLGQSVSDFSVSTLIEHARDVIRRRDVTELSRRDCDRFIRLLEDAEARPNEALVKAAKRYKKNLG